MVSDEAKALVPAAVQTASAAELGEQVAERLVSEIFSDVRAGRQGLYIPQPDGCGPRYSSAAIPWESSRASPASLPPRSPESLLACQLVHIPGFPS